MQSNLFYAKQLILCKTTYYNLLKKQLIQNNLFYTKQLITISLPPFLPPSYVYFSKQLQILSMEAMDFNGNTYNL
jgi:hypothetical protein